MSVIDIRHGREKGPVGDEDTDGRSGDGQAHAPAPVDAWVLHRGVAADDYTMHLDGAGALAIPVPRSVRIATGRTDLSTKRLLERLAHAMRERGVVGEHESLDLAGVSFEFVCVDELVHLASSFDNVVRPFPGRRGGLFLPAALAREAAKIGGRWLTESVRMSGALPAPIREAAPARVEKEGSDGWVWSAGGAEQGKTRTVVLTERPNEARAMALAPIEGFEWMVKHVGAMMMAAGLGGALAAKLSAGGAISIRLMGWMAGVVVGMIVFELGRFLFGALAKKRAASRRAALPAYTNRFRDGKTRRIGTFRGMRTVSLVRWEDEPERVEELSAEATEKLERFTGGVLVDRSAGREAAIEGQVERIMVLWDGQEDEQSLDDGRMRHFQPLESV